MMLLRIMVRVPLLLVGSLIMAILTSPQLALLFLGLIPVVLVALVARCHTTPALGCSGPPGGYRHGGSADQRQNASG